MYNGLKEYIRLLDEKGELRHIMEFVDPVLEIACATDIESKKPSGGKALLFENTGTTYPVLTNMMGSEARIRYALVVDSLEGVGARIEDLVDSVLGANKSLRNKLKMLPLLGQAAKWMPRMHKGHACRTVYRTAQPAPGPEMLAGGRRPLHHPSPREHGQPLDRHPQCRHVPDAGA